MYPGLHHPEEHSGVVRQPRFIAAPASHRPSSRPARIVLRSSRRASACSGLGGSGPDHITTIRFPAAGPDPRERLFLPVPVFRPPAESCPAAAEGACTRLAARRTPAGLLPGSPLEAERQPRRPVTLELPFHPRDEPWRSPAATCWSSDSTSDRPATRRQL